MLAFVRKSEGGRLLGFRKIVVDTSVGKAGIRTALEGCTGGGSAEG